LQKNPNNFTTYTGLARGLSATGDYKTALKNVQLALPLAPNKPSKDIAEDMKKKLSEGRDVN
jgi:cytochrome c-type biogenesis protein CcmH/NrfG